MANPTTNFQDDYGADLGTKLITKDYFISVYPGIAGQIGIPPELWIWGGTIGGSLGVNDNISRSTPLTTFAGGTNWKQVSCGGYHVAAIKTDGTLWTWGYGNYGELGTNAIVSKSTPVTTFAGGTNWKQVACGQYHTTAIKTDGTLWTWGRSNFGQLGNNAVATKSTPVTTFAGGTNWKQVACGNNHTVAIKTDGTLWTWGYGSYGRLGTNSTATRSTPVTTFVGGTNWKQVAGGSVVTAAVQNDGTLWTWGRNNYGQLGTNDGNNRSTPTTTFAGGTNWKQVACGNVHMVSIKTDGTLWTWGSHGTLTPQGALGTNDTINRSTPVTTFSGGTNWKQVSVSAVNTSAIKTDGTLWTWGRNNTGQLGINDITDRSTPVTTFAGGTNWKQVSLGISPISAIQSVDYVPF